MSPVMKLVVQRLSLGLFLLLASSALMFALTEILPGDAATARLGQQATPENLANLREEMGLNRPALIRYGEWLGGILTGNMGESVVNGQPIGEQISRRMKATLLLAGTAAVIAVPLALFLGLLAVRYRGRIGDKLISAITLTSISLPEFVIGYLIMFVFAVKLGWAPPFSLLSPSMSFAETLQAIALPASVLVLVVLAHMMRMTRAAILNVMQGAYIETAELKGLTRFSIIFKHALPNAVGPIANVVMINLAYMVVGVMAVEVVFTYPGMGQYLVDAVVKRDIPVVLSCSAIFAAVYILLNMLADIIAILANPRLRHPR